jgi:DtxR family Mn-dependent transcriptional regulator
MATSTVEDYVKAILLEEQKTQGDRVATGQVASALGVAPGTATSMLKTLAASELADYEPYSGVRLTASGRRLALHVLRRHRLIELFLVQHMGMDWSEVHADAENLEHAVSERLVDRMDELLGHPGVDPHGDPIPDAHGEVAEIDLVILSESGTGTVVQVERVSDQNPEFLQLIDKQGLKPGRRLRIEARDEASDTVSISVPGGSTFQLGFRAAAKILVRPVE